MKISNRPLITFTDVSLAYGKKIILKEPYYPKRPVKKLMKQTGAKMVELVNYPGGRPKVRTYLQNLEVNIHDLVLAIGG